MAEYRVDSFVIRQWSSRSISRGDSGVAVAGIYLYEGESRRGHIYFYSDETDLRAPIHRKAESQILLNFSLSQFEGTLAMLTGGDDLYLFFRSGTDAGLSTRRQSTGKGIGRAVSADG